MKLLGVLLALLMPLTSQAENWVTVSMMPGAIVQVDADSISKDEVLNDTATLNIRVPAGGTGYVEYNSTAGCRTFILSTTRSILHSSSIKDPVPLDHTKSSSLRYQYYAYTDPFGKAIKYACEKIDSPGLAELKAMSSKCSNKENALSKLECGSNEEVRVNFKLLFERTMDLLDNCEVSKDELSRQYGEVMIAAIYCADDKCRNDLMQRWISLYGTDLVSVVDWYYANASAKTKAPAEVCVALQKGESEIAKLKSERETKKSQFEARDAYYQCAKKAIARLDDKTSSADVIARGAHGACNAEFYEVLKSFSVSNEDRDMVYKAAEPKLIQLVLENRVAVKPGTSSPQTTSSRKGRQM